MKKLLTLFLVLCVAAITNAAIVQLRVDSDATDGAGNDTEKNASSATITVVSDTVDFTYPYYLAIWVGDEDGGSYGAITKLAAAGASASVGTNFNNYSDESYAQLTDIIALAYPPDSHVTVGDHFYTTLTLTGSAVQIDLLDADAETVIDSVTLIPEPMTILLLGIGGLFLRRRK